MSKGAVCRSSRAALRCAALAAALLGAGTSGAQPVPAAPTATASADASAAPVPTVAPTATSGAPAGEDADRTFRLAREAYKAEKYQQALELFLRSQALEATPGTLLNIALTEEKLGKTGSALRDFQRVTEQLKLDDDRLPVAREGVGRMAVRAPRLKIDRAAGAPPTLAIKIDGAPLAANLVGAEQPMDPGPHVVTTSVVGFDEKRYEVTLSEGQHLPLVVEPGQRVMVAGPAETASSQPVTAPPNAARLGAFALGGAGLGALGVGVVAGVVALLRKDDLAAPCAAPGPACDAQKKRIEAEGRTYANVATGALIAGGVATALGVVTLMTLGDGKSLFVSAGVSPSGGGLTAIGRF